MSKQELIEKICENSRGVGVDFLSMFSVNELDSYLEKLLTIDLEELAQIA